MHTYCNQEQLLHFMNSQIEAFVDKLMVIVQLLQKSRIWDFRIKSGFFHIFPTLGAYNY